MPAATAAVCGCGVRHRSESAAAKCPDAVSGGPVVDAEDVAGVLGLLDGRLVLTRDGGVLAVTNSVWRGPVLPRQFATLVEVFGALVEAGADPEVMSARLLKQRRAGLPMIQAIPEPLMAAACEALTVRAREAFKSAA